jgi:hypothetical protein
MAKETPMTTSSSVTRPEAPAAEGKSRRAGPMARKGVHPSLWDAFHTTRLSRYARIGTFLTALALGSTWFVFDRTEAQIGDDLLGMGASLMTFADEEHTDGPRALSINGETVHLVSGSSAESLADVLDAFEEMCLSRDAQFRQQITDLYRENPDLPRRSELETFRPSLRRMAGDRGTIGCLDMGTERRTAGEILDAASEFRRTGDLSVLGNMRYIFAQEADGGRTQYVALWTEGEFHVDHVLPSAGDAPGEDLAGIPRAPDAVRTLYAHEMGRDDRFVIYDDSSMSEWELEHFYRTELAREGWNVVESREEGAEQQLVVALREGRQVYISLDTDFRGHGRAVVALSE